MMRKHPPSRLSRLLGGLFPKPRFSQRANGEDKSILWLLMLSLCFGWIFGALKSSYQRAGIPKQTTVGTTSAVKNNSRITSLRDPSQSVINEEVSTEQNVQPLYYIPNEITDQADRERLDKELWDTLSYAAPDIKETARQFAMFGNTGNMSDIRSLDHSNVESLAKFVVQNLSSENVSSFLEYYFGIPRRKTLAKADLESSLVDLFDAILGDSFRPPPETLLIFTDECAPNGRVLGATHVLPSGISQVYAVFENAGQLRGENSVFVVWRDLGDDRMKFSEHEPLRISGAYNYVWLELYDGWSPGRYQLDLYDSDQHSILLATNVFRVK
jgi:hypothetical protein